MSAVEIESFTSASPAIIDKLRAAHTHVLRPCFEEIGAPIESVETLLDLTKVKNVNPDSEFHLILASDETGKPVGATCYITYKNKKTCFWIYEGVGKEYRKNKIASKLHERMDADLTSFFSDEEHLLLAELSKSVDRTVLYEKMESLGLKELAFDYVDALGDKNWILCMKAGKYGAAQIEKETLLEVLKSNRELALLKTLLSEEAEKDPVISSNNQNIKAINGKYVPVHSVPLRYRGKGHRENPSAVSCPDSL